MRTIRKALKLAILATAIFYGSAAAYLYFNQTRLTFHPTREWTTTPEAAGLAYENVTFYSQDGTPLSGWWIPAPASGAQTVLYCHGNATNISDHMREIKLFYGLGWNVFVFDYRGYGKSGGMISEKGLLADAIAAYSYLITERDMNQADLVVAGRSLGAAMAAFAASHFQPRALIIESGFISLAEVGQSLYPLFPVRYLLKYRFEMGRYLDTVRCPVLMVHSPDDTLVPLQQGRKLFEKARSPKEFFEIRGPHNEGYYQSEDIYREKLRSFFSGL